MDAYSQIPLTLAANKAGLAAGTTTTLSMANQVDFSIKGKAYRKAATTNEATPTTDAVTAAAFAAIGVSKGSVFTICRDSSGALQVVQGSIETLDSAGNFTKAPRFGPQPDTLCPIGYLLVQVGATGAAWTFSSSNLAGPPTGVTLTWVDVFTLPDRPQTS